MIKAKNIFLKFLILMIFSSTVSFSQDEGCVPDGSGPCPDVCNPMCCYYDPDNDICIPINHNSEYLIYLGFIILVIVIFSSKNNLVLKYKHNFLNLFIKNTFIYKNKT